MKRFWLRVLGYFQTFSQLENGKIIWRTEEKMKDAMPKEKKRPKWLYAKSWVSNLHRDRDRASVKRREFVCTEELCFINKAMENMEKWNRPQIFSYANTYANGRKVHKNGNENWLVILQQTAHIHSIRSFYNVCSWFVASLSLSLSFGLCRCNRLQCFSSLFPLIFFFFGLKEKVMVFWLLFSCDNFAFQCSY